MSRRIRQVGFVLGTLALTAVFLAPVSGNKARAVQAAVPTPPGYTDAAAVAGTPNPTTPGNSGDNAQKYRNHGDYMYGMMGEMMGPCWNYREHSGRSSQGNYPYYGMMGGYWGYPGQSGGAYTPPQEPGGVSGTVYGNQSGWSMPSSSL